MTAQSTAGFKRQILGAAVALLGLIAPGWAFTPVAITFHGDSTLHGFGGAVEGRMVEEIGPGGETVVAVTLPVRAMKTGHDGRDRKMYAMFEADSFAAVSGRMPASMLREPGGEVTASLHLAIHGREQDLPATLSVVPATEHSPLRHRLVFDVSLKAFGLVAPSVIGLIRVADTVHVTAEWVDGQAAEGARP